MGLSMRLGARLITASAFRATNLAKAKAKRGKGVGETQLAMAKTEATLGKEEVLYMSDSLFMCLASGSAGVF